MPDHILHWGKQARHTEVQRCKQENWDAVHKHSDTSVYAQSHGKIELEGTSQGT